MRTVDLLLSVISFSAAAAALQFGQMCDPTPIYRESSQYDDSCADLYLYCDPISNTCNYKGCSNADYIQGWDPLVRPFPVRCNGTTFCPDNGSQCTEEAPVGSRCEIQRDDECAGQNPICLNSICHIKGAPLGGNCGSDITTYVTYDQEGDILQQTIIRDNCTDGTYCNNDLCITSKINGISCEQDRECLSGTCSNDGECINGPDTFHQIQPWLWGVLGAAVVIFVLFVLGLLWILHRYQSKQEHAKIVKFFGDNEEFAKYAMMNDEDSMSDSESRANLSLHNNESNTSLVYLTLPDYQKSQGLTLKNRNSYNSNANQSNTRLSTLSLSNLNTRAHAPDQ